MECVTCPICSDEIQIAKTGALRYCKCGCLCVDSTEEYTKYIGILPIEDPGYAKLYAEKCDTIDKLKHMQYENIRASTSM
jgi:hypothetical protein